MPSTREMRLRIRSIKNIAQVTKALETVSASKVRRATQAVAATKPYADKAWHLLLHLARQPGHASLHPLLNQHNEVKKVLVLMVSGDRGLAGAFNVNVLRYTMDYFKDFEVPVSYVVVGRKGRDMMLRRRMNVAAEFSNLPSPPTFMDVSSISRLMVEDFLNGSYDEVYMVYTEYKNMLRQQPVVQKLLPLKVEEQEASGGSHAVFTYEPDAKELLDEIIPRLTAIQVYQAILSSQASEHAARMIAMRNATDNAMELMAGLQLEYNKARQQSITNDMLDISGGANALADASRN
jgi:F-type H+-transporting ATPase subunit gamma